MTVFYAAIILNFISCISSHRTTSIPSTTLLVPLSKACDAGTVTVNDCNKCVCTSKQFFHCISKPCNQTITETKNEASCKPDMLYIKNETACLCKNDGSWPHETCKTVFNSFQDNSKGSCKPNSFVILDCNVCKCGPDGLIDKARCTKNKCEPEKRKSRRYIKQNKVYGSCEAQNWYSLAPCQFCFCISENKLVCNTGNSYAMKLQLGSYNLSICGKELIKDAMNLIPDREKALRFGINKTINEPDAIETTTEYHTYIEDNREINKNIVRQQVEEQQVLQQQYKNAKDSEEYYTDSEEAKAQNMDIGREGSSTKLPYEEDENNLSSESENDNQGQFAIDIDPSTTTEVPAIDIDVPPPSSILRGDFPQHLEWTGPAPNNGQIDEAFNLGDVLKPYLPVVLDKVFQMALRKSMVSIDANSNCTPGATTVFKCNACFCMKNKKLLCTKNECK